VSLAHRYHAVLVPRAKRPPPPGSELYLTVPGPTVGALPAHRDTGLRPIPGYSAPFNPGRSHL